MTETPGAARDSSSTGFRVPVTGIFLVGFMGTGKTSVGRVLAEILGWTFIDLDHHIEGQEGLTIAEIFQRHGERGFRDREHRALRKMISELKQGQSRVVALGGGAFVQNENAELLASTDMPTVFLDTPVDELWERCLALGEPERPLRGDPVAFRALHEKRLPQYMRATIRVETVRKDIEQIAKEILTSLNLEPRVARKEITK